MHPSFLEDYRWADRLAQPISRVMVDVLADTIELSQSLVGLKSEVMAEYLPRKLEKGFRTFIHLLGADNRLLG